MSAAVSGGDEPAHPEPASILLVDDRPENLRALEAVLEPLGCRIVSAASGPEALRLLLVEEQFAVILLDVQMPEMDGFETATYIRHREKTRTIPIIFLTAISSGPEHVFRGYEAGAVDYIVKPVDPAILRSKVAVFVELHEKGREIARQAVLLRQRELERAEREQAERRHRRSHFLATASVALEKRVEVRGRMKQLTRVCVPELADFALVELLHEDGELEVVAVAHRNRELEKRLQGLLRTAPDRSSLGSWFEASPATRLMPEVTPAAWAELGLGETGDRVLEALRPRFVVGAPLMLRGQSLGALVLGRSRSRRSYEEDEIELVKELARTAAMALENARLYEAERERSRTLQLSLLGTHLLENPAVTAAMRYTPGAAELEVGGDWYDVIEREDGRIVAVVGDVVGRGIHAATAMGKLRSAVAALALVVDTTPELLNLLDQFSRRVEGAEFATMACVFLEPETGLVRYSLAGHPPVLVVGPDGSADYLKGGQGLPLGVGESEVLPRTEASATLAPGATLVLFTDGLVERRDVSIDVGLERLMKAATERSSHEPERLCDELLEQFVDTSRDDVALVCLRLEARGAETFGHRFPSVPSALGGVRRALREWLAERGLPREEIEDVVLACSEACANVIRHAYAKDPGDGVLEVRLARDGNLTARVRDTGEWRAQLTSEERGRGIGIMRAIMDDFHSHTTSKGTTVVMQKRLSPRPEATASVGAAIPASGAQA